MDNKVSKFTTLYFYITGGCNLNCKHCWITPDSASADLTLGEAQETLRQAKEAGAQSVKFTGGEPFLRKDIFEILAFARQEGLKISIETNGTFIQDEEARKLKELDVEFISVSLDSNIKDNHDTLRGVSGAFELACRGIQALKKAGFSPQVIASISRKDTPELERLADYVRSLGAGSLKINPIFYYGRAQEFFKKEELLGVEELIKLEKHINEVVQPRVRMPILLDIPPAFKKLSVIKSHGGVCHILNMLGVLSDGTVSLCGIGQATLELNMGNIKKDSLQDVWNNSELLHRMRQDIPDHLEGVCGKCVFKRFCLGKCRAHSFYEQKSLTAPFYFCQEAYDLGHFPKSRLISYKKEKTSEGKICCA